MSTNVPQIPVTLTFTPPPPGSTTPTWTCVPSDIKVPAKSSAYLAISLVTAGSDSQVATYATPVDAAVVWPLNPQTNEPDAPPEWAWGAWLDTNPAVINVSITNWGSTTKGNWPFSLQVNYDSTPYTSPDPTIINIDPT